jgi:hypothetical protein
MLEPARDLGLEQEVRVPDGIVGLLFEELLERQDATSLLTRQSGTWIIDLIIEQVLDQDCGANQKSTGTRSVGPITQEGLSCPCRSL